MNHLDNVEEIYTTIGEAKEEIKRRRNDPKLRKMMEEYWNGNLPEVFKKEPRAIFFRAILTPNFETSYFLDLMDLIEIKPVCAELYTDKFCTMNKDKVHLGKLVFLHSSHKNQCDLITKKIIINFDESEKKPFTEIRTLNNKSFIEFHHHLYKKQFKGIMDIFDVAESKNGGKSAREIYELMFSICLVNGILFENFIAKEGEHEKRFVEDVVIPAFKSVKEKFNLKPLIVPLLPLKNEEKESWIYYPGHLEEEAEDYLRSN